MNPNIQLNDLSILLIQSDNENLKIFKEILFNTTKHVGINLNITGLNTLSHLKHGELGRFDALYLDLTEEEQILWTRNIREAFPNLPIFALVRAMSPRYKTKFLEIGGTQYFLYENAADPILNTSLVLSLSTKATSRNQAQLMVPRNRVGENYQLQTQ